MYFSEHKRAVEIDEKRHTDRNQNWENERQAKIEKHSDCKFFHRINRDAGSFDIFVEISKIQNYVTRSNKEKIKTRKRNERTKRQNKSTRKQNRRTKEQVCKRII